MSILSIAIATSAMLGNAFIAYVFLYNCGTWPETMAWGICQWNW